MVSYFIAFYILRDESKKKKSCQIKVGCVEKKKLSQLLKEKVGKKKTYAYFWTFSNISLDNSLY